MVIVTVVDGVSVSNQGDRVGGRPAEGDATSGSSTTVSRDAIPSTSDASEAASSGDGKLVTTVSLDGLTVNMAAKGGQPRRHRN
jgi:hypothetical protein